MENTEQENNKSAAETPADSATSAVVATPAAGEAVVIDFGKAVSESFEIFKKNAGLLIGATIVGSLAGAFCFVIMPIVFVGFNAIALRLIDGDKTPPTIGDVFAKFNFFLPALVALLLGGLGELACCVGGLVTIPVAMLAFLRMYDKGDTSVCGAFCEVFKRVTNGGWMLLVWVLVVNFINVIATSMCFVVVLATAPLGTLVIAHVYRQAFPK